MIKPTEVFITGSTGVLGLEVTKLAVKSGYNVAALIRARSAAEYHLKCKKVQTFAGDDENLIRFCRGDVVNKNMGLEKEDYGNLTETVQHVIHCAGDVHLNQDREAALAMSLNSVREIAQFCKAAGQRGPYKKAEIISTVGVGGRDVRLLPERFLVDSDFPSPPQFHNNYEWGKYQTECFLRDHKNDLPAFTVHRPSMIVGRADDGLIARFQVFYHIVEALLGKKTFGFLPSLANRSLDLIPVDTVAKGVLFSIKEQTLAGHVLNHASGPELAVSLTEVKRYAEQAFSEHGVYVAKSRLIPSWLVNAASTATERNMPLPMRKLRALSPIVEYLSTDQAFSSVEFQSLQRRHGESSPNPKSFLPKTLDYYLEQKYLEEAHVSQSRFIREIKGFEFLRDSVWPHIRVSVGSTVSSRCERCAISAKIEELVAGICQSCREQSARKPSKQDSQNLFSEFDWFLENQTQRTTGHYDAIALFSGGKDSTYMIQRLKTEYPKLKILALTVDNTFMSPVAMANVDRAVKKLGIEHLVLRPSRAMMRKIYSQAFLSLNSTLNTAIHKGCSGTVDQFDGDFLHDTGRRIAKLYGAPLVLSGLSPDQVESIMGLKTFCHPEEEDAKPRRDVVGLPLSKILTPQEVEAWWWNGAEGETPPRMVYPFYVWRLTESEIKATIKEKGLLQSSNHSPLLTNSRLVPLMSAVDFAQLGYSSFEREFARNIREGSSDLASWRNTFELAEFTAKTGLLLNHSVNEVLRELGLNRKQLGLPESINWSLIASALIKNRF